MKRKIIGPLCFVLAAVLGVWGFYRYAPHFMDYHKNQRIYTDLKEKYVQIPRKSKSESTEPETNHRREEPVAEEMQSILSVDGEALQQTNSDYIGWIHIPDTAISYPVVLSSDNTDYLHTDFYGGYNFGGTIFMDYRCKGIIECKHSILYGHNMLDGSMFSGILNFRDQSFADSHPYFYFITPEQTYQYEIYAACCPDSNDKVHYGVDWRNKDEFYDALIDIQSCSLIQRNIDLSEVDHLMTLSTCIGDTSQRCTVHGILKNVEEL